MLPLRALRRVALRRAAPLRALASRPTAGALARSAGRARILGASRAAVLQRRAFAAGDERTIEVPGMGDSITEGEIGSWLVAEGEAVAADDVVCEIETDKIAVEIRAPTAGVVVKHCAAEGDAVRVGAELYVLRESDAADAKADNAKADNAKADDDSSATPPPPFQASAERTAGSGGGGPAKEEPASAAAAINETRGVPNQTTAASSGSGSGSGKSSAAPPVPPPPRVAGERTERRVKMKKIRVRIAERLKDAQNTYAMLTTFNEVDMSALINMRSEYKDLFEKQHGVKLGFMSAFVKAASDALQAVPSVNAVIDGNEVVYRDYVDVSVAVSSPSGLVVPVLRNTESMSLADIEHNIAALAAKARNNELSMEEMAGGTFTISNGGVFGSMMGTPIINPPQSAILGMHATKPRPVAIDGKVEIRPVMYLALTYDHRLIDGREGVSFLVHIKNMIEDPRRLLLGV